MSPARRTARTRSAIGVIAKQAVKLEAERPPQRITGLRGAAKAVVAAELIRAHSDRPVLLLTASAKTADAWQAELTTLLGVGTPGDGQNAERLVPYPRHDTLPYERFSPQPFLTAARMAMLYRWLASAQASAARREEAALAPVTIAPATALGLRVPAPEALRSRTVHLEVGQTVDRDALIERLVAAGYARMPIVEEPGEVAVRGGILDLYPPHETHPVRIELLGDEIESLRSFDPASQRSAGQASGRRGVAAARAALRSRAHHRVR